MTFSLWILAICELFSLLICELPQNQQHLFFKLESCGMPSRVLDIGDAQYRTIKLNFKEWEWEGTETCLWGS